jgi:putative peptidoglycan lipid II flippase
VLAATAMPVAQLLVTVMHRATDPGNLAAGIAAFAPGLLGYGLLALLSRALYAAGQARWAAGATAAGWAVTAVSGLALALTLDAGHRVVALAAANTIGMTVLGAALLLVVARRIGRAALKGVTRAAATAALAGAAGAGAGAALAHGVAALTTPGLAADLTAGMLAGVAAAAGFLLVGLVMDRRDLGSMLTGLARRLRRGRRAPVAGDPAPTSQR